MNQDDKDTILAILDKEPAVADIKVVNLPALVDSHWSHQESLMVGSTVNVDRGAWIGDDDVFEYQWARDGDNIAGETGASYVAQEADVGTEVTAVVSSIVDAGRFSIVSPAVEIGEYAPVEVFSVPEIFGTFEASGEIFGSDGVWRGADYVLSYEWTLNDEAFSTLPDAVIPATATSGDVVKWTVTATDCQSNTASASVETTLA